MPSRRTSDESDPLTAEMLAEARADAGRTWTASALCADADPALFFPPADDPAAEARQICANCPVQGHCLAYSVIADEPFGI